MGWRGGGREREREKKGERKRDRNMHSMNIVLNKLRNRTLADADLYYSLQTLQEKQTLLASRSKVNMKITRDQYTILIF